MLAWSSIVLVHVRCEINGVMHEAAFPIEPDQTFAEVFEAAHSQPDSSIPVGLLPDFDASVRRLRAVENELLRLMGKPELPT